MECHDGREDASYFLGVSWSYWITCLDYPNAWAVAGFALGCADGSIHVYQCPESSVRDDALAIDDY